MSRTGEPLESAIEARACLELEKIGCISIKLGQDGWPDRLVVYAPPDRMLFMEFKQPSGVLGPAQKVRIKQLGRIRVPVHVVTSWRDALAIVAKERRRDAKTR